VAEDPPRLRLTIEFRGTHDWPALVWTIRSVLDQIQSSPVPMTIRFERVDDAQEGDRPPSQDT
jgi:hypothetical protein